ncbi:hypothetical protein P5673_026997 [Acropora cervicornis]|uniref:Uncharacterized protein n=1 Tax=Acropora cervicornis TaxID=6130 RepID=A0AAD9Q030_ACRCE|nr:hypothetical protein P5673_026997 [Acropora cervicornis]
MTPPGKKGTPFHKPLLLPRQRSRVQFLYQRMSTSQSQKTLTFPWDQLTFFASHIPYSFVHEKREVMPVPVSGPNLASKLPSINREFTDYMSAFTKMPMSQARTSVIQTVAKTQNIFILVRNSNMDGDMYNGFLFNRRYQTRETNAHQSGPSRLIIYPGYQQFHPINVSTSHDESPARSESPSGSSGSGSEHVSKRWEATLVKILISAYKDNHEI